MDLSANPLKTYVSNIKVSELSCEGREISAKHSTILGSLDANNLMTIKQVGGKKLRTGILDKTNYQVWRAQIEAL